MASPLRRLERFDWRRPSESGADQELSKLQYEKASDFLKAASTKRAEGIIELLFRGETQVRLGERLCRDEAAPLGKIASALFYFGEKGKHFWKDEIRRRLEEERTKWNTVVRSIDDLSAESFERLLRHIASILKLDAGRSFRTGNAEFCQIIEGESGLKDLTSRFAGLSAADKRWVRDLFIYICHSFSRRDYKTYTPFVSTTPNFKRAEFFAKKGAKGGGNPCVICLFLRAGRVDWVLRSDDLAAASKRLVGLGLPPINRLFFKETEVAFFGALFPHLIFTILNLTSKVAFWNPPVLDVSLNEGADVWRNGFPIDQTDFNRFIREQTGYARGIARDPEGEKEILSE